MTPVIVHFSNYIIGELPTFFSNDITGERLAGFDSHLRNSLNGFGGNSFRISSLELVELSSPPPADAERVVNSVVVPHEAFGCEGKVKAVS